MTVPNPRSVDPAASVKDALDPVDFSVPPPSWITPSLTIAAFAVVQLRPASKSSSPLAPIVRSVVSTVLVRFVVSLNIANVDPAPIKDILASSVTTSALFCHGIRSPAAVTL